MPPDLTSSNWKIDRAKDLLHTLDCEVREWIDSKPYNIFPYVSPEFTRASIIVKELRAPEIVRWSLMIADIVHNLRCALDHAFWAVLLHAFPAGLPAKTDKLTFPIWDDPPNSDQVRPLKPLGGKILDAIKAVQPYNNPVTAFPVHELAIIRDIDNGNKHRLLFTAMSSIARINVKATGIRKSYENASISEIYKGELKDGVEAIVTTFDIPHPYLKYECTEFYGIIAIRHPKANRLGQDRDDYAALIDSLLVQVRQTIDEFVIKAL
jgi:hypothetical protein